MPTSQSTFQVFDTTLPGITPNLFGVWDTAPLPNADVVSFEAGTAPAADIPVWRAAFPSDPDEARKLLNAQHVRLEQVHQTMPQITARFDALTAAHSEGVSFEAQPGQTALTAPEQELERFLNALQADKSQVSFGFDLKSLSMLKAWPDTVARFQTFLQQATRTIGYAAWVETYVEQSCLARTGVGWGGDTHTVWRRNLDAEQRPLHEQNLTLALTSRQELVTMVTFAVQTAMRLAALLNMPGNIIKILPAVWTCLQQLFEQCDDKRP